MFNNILLIIKTFNNILLKSINILNNKKLFIVSSSSSLIFYTFYNNLYASTKTINSSSNTNSNSTSTNLPSFSIASNGKNINEFTTIIVGAGTAGCVTAYLLSIWFKENNIPGNILLIDRGIKYNDPLYSPHPKMSEWFNNWQNFTISHDSIYEGGSPHPVPGSEHKGIGGSGISFMPSSEQCMRYSQLMGWSSTQFYMYLQTALNMIPLSKASVGERFYNAVIETLSRRANWLRLPGDEYKARIVPDSVAYVSVGMYADETRWTSANLLAIAPDNLIVLSDADVEKVLISDQNKENNSLKATGIVIKTKEGRSIAQLDKYGEVVVSSGSLGTPLILQRSGIGPSHILRGLDIPVLVSNDKVGKGVDHQEAPVVYQFLEDKWLEHDGSLPRGGAMAWPLVLFANLNNLRNQHTSTTPLMQAHIGISAPPYNDELSLVATPNCTQPKQSFLIQATSVHSDKSSILLHEPLKEDLVVLREGVRQMVSYMEMLREEGVVGQRLQPPKNLDLSDDDELNSWIKSNLGTAFHWMSTCQAGLHGNVADEHFRVRAGRNSRSSPLGGNYVNKVGVLNSHQPRDSDSSIVDNLRVGSGACLPEIPESNPYVTITAFSVALAHSLLNEQISRHSKGLNSISKTFKLPTTLNAALIDTLLDSTASKVRLEGFENPDLSKIAKEHRKHVDIHQSKL